MPIIRKFAIQGHEVPKQVYSPRGLEGAIDRKVMNQASVYYDGTEHGDSLHEAFDDIRLFRCKDCATILYEDELSAHECEDENENSFLEAHGDD
jgi:hypothetical protein